MEKNVFIFTGRAAFKQKVCPECGETFKYPEMTGYEPTTCGKIECVRNHLHPYLKNKRVR
jgi:hypothetical protein